MADIQLRHFQIPASGDEAADEALNRFLRSHQVLRVHEEFVSDGAEGAWYVSVRYAVTGAGTGRGAGGGRSEIDYKDVLEPKAFARFVELKKRRKGIAEVEGVPAFAVFTDKELAGIAELENPTLEALKKVEGLGAKRVERFGARILNPVIEKEPK